MAKSIQNAFICFTTGKGDEKTKDETDDSKSESQTDSQTNKEEGKFVRALNSVMIQSRLSCCCHAKLTTMYIKI